jgi:hypothetical protein
MSNIGMQFHSALEIFPYPIVLKVCSAIVAEFGSKMVFTSTFIAMVAHFPRWHSNKVTVCTFDDLDITNHKFAVHRDRAKSFEPVILVAYQFYSHLTDLHG